jgi:hypothetical protein
LGLDVGPDQLLKLHKIEEKLRQDRLALEEEKEKFARYHKFIVQQIRDTQVQHQAEMKATIMEWQEQNNLLDRKDAILTQKKIHLEEVEEEVEGKYLDAGMLKMIGNSLVEVNTLRIKEELDALNKVFERKLRQVELKEQHVNEMVDTLGKRVAELSSVITNARLQEIKAETQLKEKEMELYQCKKRRMESHSDKSSQTVNDEQKETVHEEKVIQKEIGVQTEIDRSCMDDLIIDYNPLSLEKASLSTQQGFKTPDKLGKTKKSKRSKKRKSKKPKELVSTANENVQQESATDSKSVGTADTLNTVQQESKEFDSTKPVGTADISNTVQQESAETDSLMDLFMEGTDGNDEKDMFSVAFANATHWHTDPSSIRGEVRGQGISIETLLNILRQGNHHANYDEDD